MKKNVLFIGSGELTNYIVPLMLEKGCLVTLTTTTPEKIEKLTNQYSKGMEVVLLEGSDLQAMEKVVKGKDVIILAVAPIKKRIKSISNLGEVFTILRDTYKLTAQNLVRSCQSLNNKPKVIYISAHSIYPSVNSQIVNEETKGNSGNFINSALRDAENMILDWIPQSVSLRMGWMLSETRNWKHTFELWKQYNSVLPGDGKNPSNMVNMEDSARSVIFAIENNLEGIYNVCGEAHPGWKELFDVISQQLGVDPPKWDPESREECFEGDHIVSNEKIKNAGFLFSYPREMGLKYIV